MQKYAFLIKRLHSLSGIIPIGFFLIEHLTTNSFALMGSDYYDQKIAAFQKLPFLIGIEIIFIAVPILFHTVLGIYYVYLAKNNILQYTYYRNYMFYLQRITAVVTALFVAYHVYTARIGRALADIEISYQFMNEILSQPIFFILYLIGLLAAVFHFSNGIYTFAISWGITIGPRAQKVFERVSIVLFIILSVIGTAGLLALAA